MSVLARGHLLWIGPRLSWASAFAVLSAARRGALDEIVLHHTEALADEEPLRCLLREPGVRLCRIDPLACLEEAGAALGSKAAFTALYRRLCGPVMRADLLRAAILFCQGGLYADLDTVTTASLRPLLAAPAFIGSERIVWPEHVRRSRSPRLWARHLGLDLARKTLRRLPQGWRLFRKIESRYFLGVNNAVMGSEAKGPFFAAYLAAMLALPEARQTELYALGPELLQELLPRAKETGLVVHPPEVFSPLGPEISAHWFRLRRHLPPLAEVLAPTTRLVHWYASIGGTAAAEISPDSVRRNRTRQLYSALVWECLGGAAGLP